MVGSHWRVWQVEFDCIWLRRGLPSENEETEEKEDTCTSELDKIASRGYLECNVPVDAQEKTERKERKKRRREGEKVLPSAVTNGSNRR